MRKFNILNLHYTDKDGAGNAAIRHHLQFLRLGHKSISIVNHKKTSNINVFEVNHNRLRYIFQRIILKIQDQFNLFKREYEFHNRGAYYVKSPNVIFKQLEELDFVPDLIFLSWNSKFISYKDVAHISKFYKAKLYIWIWDKEVFTGGCHYTNGCNGYKNDCINCPAVLKFNRLPNANFVSKKQAYLTSQPTFIYTAPWMKELMLAPLISSYKGVYVPTFFSSLIENVAPSFYTKSDKEKHSLLEFYKIPPNKLKIGFASVNLSDRRKGFIYFRQLIQKLNLNKSIDFHVITIGSGNSKIKDVNESKISSFGSVSDESKRNDIYNMMDIFISTPIEDMGPQTLCEAMLCGATPICFPVGISIDVINNLNGYLTKNICADDLLTAVLDFYHKNEEYKNTISKNAANSMRELYDSEKSDKAINELIYEEVK